MLKYKNGKIYKGQFNNNEPNGEGKMIYQDGTTLKGFFKDGHLLN